ncbi:DEAD-domain-containing protein [Pisolithus orientalis]|uniref:DEAD-domain-containing protein n=1 Tax=Pisolithus orientalis TaxID=936130 RepID=UPI00222465EB|nr:DEAD-domain-containing protein [Pisolithus orientalis]KAI5991311.1 DEAD-domain-containing protein [Pisolithus orientalis]
MGSLSGLAATMATDNEEGNKVTNKSADAGKRKDKKKDRHRKRKQSDPADVEAVPESPSEPGKSSKKDRKRKREIEVGDTTTQENITKSKKKKKHDADAQNSPQLVPTIHASPPSSSEGQAFLEKHSPTPIQAAAWPWALAGKDVVGIAETGSGKTLAFGIPALSRLIATGSNGSAINVLVVAPTRELAIQTHDTLSALGAPFGMASVAVYGGVDKSPQIKALSNNSEDGKTTRIVVGTPGRILDLVNDGACDLSKVNYLVLDEADRMLDKGFEHDITAIISHTMQRSDRQTMMFSATWPEAVRRLASAFLRDPVRVTVGSDDLTANSRCRAMHRSLGGCTRKRVRTLSHLTFQASFQMLDYSALLAKHLALLGCARKNVLVFALYKKEASRVEATLKRAGHDVGALHGDMAQSARMAALEWFKSSQNSGGDGNPGKGRKNTGLRLLVATDVAARGLDIPEVGAVVNYTFPLTIEDYIHRIGRTGRGGRSGRSITFFTGDVHERALAGELARVLRDAGFGAEADKLAHKFPMTIKKKTHSAYGAFFRDDVGGAATKIVF